MRPALLVGALVVAGSAIALLATLGRGAFSGAPSETTRSSRGEDGSAAPTHALGKDAPSSRPESAPSSDAGRVANSGGAARVPLGRRTHEPGSETEVAARKPSALTTDADPATAEPTDAESIARAALRFVGKDSAAEAVWTRAINDRKLPSRVRSDLIEDLNDEGYSDPNYATQADIPLILKRLELIEKLAPLAMDEVNRIAFEEAYKDLLAMLIRLRGARPRS